jgi:hypothetical protein
LPVFIGQEEGKNPIREMNEKRKKIRGTQCPESQVKKIFR